MNKRDYNDRLFAVVEKQFNYKGHDCICIFSIRGVRCGYVSVSDKEKTFYDYDVECHCGLSFDGELPDYCNPKADYYIGFDCGHYCDGVDYDQAIKYNLIEQSEADYNKKLFSYLDDRPVRDLDYVEANCRSIVDQLERKRIK